jgi:hypothetical protein
MSSEPIDYTVLADLFESTRGPFDVGTRHLRESALAETVDNDQCNEASADTVEIIYALLSRVPETSSTANHNAECWQRHAGCLADRLIKIIDGDAA